MNEHQYLRKWAVANYGVGNGNAGEGMVVGYTNQPTVTIRCLDGSTIHWVAGLCEFRDLTEREQQLMQHIVQLQNELDTLRSHREQAR